MHALYVKFNHAVYYNVYPIIEVAHKLYDIVHTYIYCYNNNIFYNTCNI